MGYAPFFRHPYRRANNSERDEIQTKNQNLKNQKIFCYDVVMEESKQRQLIPGTAEYAMAKQSEQIPSRSVLPPAIPSAPITQSKQRLRPYAQHFVMPSPSKQDVQKQLCMCLEGGYRSDSKVVHEYIQQGAHMNFLCQGGYSKDSPAVQAAAKHGAVYLPQLYEKYSEWDHF